MSVRDREQLVEPAARHDVVAEDVHTTRPPSGDLIARVIGVLASAVPLVIGLVAVAKVDWSANGFDAPAVSVAGMTLSPAMAVGVLVAGLVALLAAAAPGREIKLVVGTLLVCAGIAVLVANPVIDRVTTPDRAGWLAIVVGGVIIATGMLVGTWTSSSRRVVTREP